jgi:type II secretory ATPase GspE/PulE/Tfp pilus assembly ATPase PilB-like protein
MAEAPLSGGSHPKTHYLTSALVEAGVLEEQQIERALARQRETGRRIGETLVEMGIASEEDIAWALARQLDLTFVDVRVEALDFDLVRAMPEALLRRMQAVPLVQVERELTVAFADPTDAAALAELENESSQHVHVAVATASQIAAALDAVFGVKREERRAPGATEHATSKPSAARHDVLWDRSGLMFLQFHVTTAATQGASEIHFVPGAGQLAVLYRIGSDLMPMAVESAEQGPVLLARIQAQGGPELPEDQVHARGRIVVPTPAAELTLDVSLARGTDGEAITLFLGPRGASAPDLDALGIEALDAARLRGVLDLPAGLVLVTGPRRSGGSTTLAALAGGCDSERRRVLFVETRPGVPVTGTTRIVASPGQAHAHWRDLAVGQAADVLALDDVLEGDAVRELLSPAASGRLLLVRTDWQDTFPLLERLISEREGRTILPLRLHAIVQQRLVRRDPRTRGGERTQFPIGIQAVFEIFFLGDAMRQAIKDGATLDRLRELAVADGYRPLADELRRRVSEGSVSRVEAARALS